MKLALCAIALALVGAVDKDKETWPITLRAAIRIGLDNGEIVRVIWQGKQATPVSNCFGPPTAAIPPPSLIPIDLPKGMHSDRSSLIIGRLNADVSIPRFKSAVMASIRSINRQYWSLAEAHAALWSAEQTVNLAQEAVKFEEAEMLSAPGRGNPAIAELADIAPRLDKFQKALANRKAEVADAERQLRKLLGLPQSDNRQIIPVDHPIKEHVIFDRAECLEVMMQKQPDIIQQKALRHLADQKLSEARNAITSASTNPLARHDNDVNLASAQPSPRSNHPLANTRTAQYAVIRSQEFLDQVVQQTAQSLDRALRDVETEYQSYAKTRRLRNAAEKRLEAQRAYWEEGRITADRYLDAVEQYGTLLTSEHHHLSAYNAALAFVSECKGTLLEDQNIIVAEPQRVARASAAPAPK
jgi:outer membrane protein TolC